VSVRRPAISSLSTSSGGALLVIVTVSLGFGLYVAVSSDGISTPAIADAVASPPLVRAEPAASSPSTTAQIASMAVPKPLPTQPVSSDRGSRIRELQKALAGAECYNGPISGIWSDASKDAMRGFVQTVNAALPVDSPDETLVALVESNETTKCARGRVISTGTLGALVQPVALQQTHSETPSAIAPQQASADTPTMIERAWAPAGMLVPPKAAPASPVVTASAHSDARPPAAEQTADNELMPAQPDPAAQKSSALHFEDNKALPAVQPADPSTLVSSSEAGQAVPEPTKPKKTKTAKRKPSKDDDVQTTISKGFDTLQRSISSMF
jgi:hypothetical protein